MSNPVVTKCTMFFSDGPGSSGWTETYYNSGSNLNTVMSNFQTLVTNRRLLLPATLKIVWLRVELLFNQRQYIGRGPGPNGQPLFGSYTGANTLPATSALLMQLYGPASDVNRLFFRGLDDGDVSGQVFTPTPAWTSAFTPFKSVLTSPGSTWVVFNRLSGPVSQHISLTQFAPLPPRGNLLTVQNNSLFQQGNVCRIKVPATQVQGLSGYKIILGTSGTTFVTVAGAAAVGQIGNTTASYIVPVNFSVNPISDISYSQLTERRVGRPFGQPVGRRPNRIPLRA